MGDPIEDKYMIQLIDQEGGFNAIALEKFMARRNVSKRECTGPSNIFSIIGAQSSGKSTLLNHLFGTKFKEMNAATGKKQTTKGIWLADCGGTNPHNFILDVEGSDGKERGEDDTLFEKQSAIFALAMSKTVLINMWHHNIGLNHGGSKPLLRIVFQAMLKLCRIPGQVFSLPRKTTLIFVIRDTDDETPLETLKMDLNNFMKEIWDSIPRTPPNEITSITDLFNVEVMPFHHYKYRKEIFMNEVASLKARLDKFGGPGEVDEDCEAPVLASEFLGIAQTIWKTIKEDKTLHFPPHKVMISVVFCEQIAQETLAGFSSNEDWYTLQNDVEKGNVNEFGNKVDSLLEACRSRYRGEAKSYDEKIKNAKEEQMIANLLQLIKPVWDSAITHLRSAILKEFESAFDTDLKNGSPDAAVACLDDYMTRFDRALNKAADITLAEWDTSSARSMLRNDMQQLIFLATADKVSTLQAKLDKYEAALLVLKTTIQVGALMSGVNLPL